MKQLTLRFQPEQLDLFEWQGVQWWVIESKMMELTLLHAHAWANHVFQPSPWMKMFAPETDASGGHNIQVPFTYVST